MTVFYGEGPITHKELLDNAKSVLSFSEMLLKSALTHECYSIVSLDPAVQVEIHPPGTPEFDAKILEHRDAVARASAEVERLISIDTRLPNS